MLAKMAQTAEQRISRITSLAIEIDTVAVQPAILPSPCHRSMLEEISHSPAAPEYNFAGWEGRKLQASFPRFTASYTRVKRTSKKSLCHWIPKAEYTWLNDRSNKMEQGYFDLI